MSNIEIQLSDDSLSLPLEEESTAAPHDSISGNGKHDNEEETIMDKEERDFLSIFGPAYATKAQFWKGIVYSSLLQGIIMAFIALAFFNLYTALSDATWLSEEYHQALNATSDGESQEDPIHMFRLGNGEWWYVGLLAGAGLAVGLVKTIWTLVLPERHAFPRNVPSFLDDIRELHADDVFLPLAMLICSAISIGLGASVGPEAALGASGTALGTLLSKRWRVGKHQAVAFQTNGDSENLNNGEQGEKPSCLSKLLPDFSQDEKHLVLDGISGAFGALFPAQYLGPMLVFELGHHWGPGSDLSATETLARTGFSASIAFVVFTSIENFTLLKQAELPAAAYDFLPDINPINMLEAGVLGIFCGLVGVVGLVILGLGKKLGNVTHDAFDRVGERLGLANRRISLGLLLTPLVGGSLTGLLCVLSPLCLADGSDQMGSLIILGQSLGAGTLAVTGVVKVLCLSFSLGFGFIGGQIFPLLFTGTCVGAAASLLIDGLPVLVAVPACMMAVPCAFVPAIFTFTTLASMILVLGGSATSPVFFACICSYTTTCGCGVLHKLFARSRASTKKKATNQTGASDEEADVMLEKDKGTAGALESNVGTA